MAETTDFQQLLERAQRGDREAIGEMYVHFLPDLERVTQFRLRKLGLHHVTTSADIHDAVFCRLLKPGALDAVTSAQHLRNFLIKACSNRLHNILVRRNASARRRCEFVPELDVEDGTRDELAGRLEHEEELQCIYAQLSPRERMLCTLRRGGWSWDEIAERLGTTPVVARQAFSRGLRRTQKLLRERGQPPAP